MMPNLVASYAASRGLPIRPLMEEQFTMAPPESCRRMIDSSCFMAAQMPRRLGVASLLQIGSRLQLLGCVPLSPDHDRGDRTWLGAFVTPLVPGASHDDHVAGFQQDLAALEFEHHLAGQHVHEVDAVRDVH